MITIYEEDSETIDVRLFEGDGITPKDVSAFTDFHLQCFPIVAGVVSLTPTAALTKTGLGGDFAFATDGTDGLLTAAIAADEIDALAGDYRIEFRAEDAGGLTNYLIDRLKILAQKVTS
jgi:hypothetical protein